jgi:predicted Zn-dependent peptidase
MKSTHIQRLPNGLRVICEVTSGPVCHAGLVWDAGSRDEADEEHGLAHFIEHVLFKGTKKRKTFHILSRLDVVGGEINAYTTKEDTWLVAAFMKDHVSRAIELMADIALNSTFPEKELNKEKVVILDEISAYEDNPGDIIFDEFEEVLFNGHTLGRNILGTPERVRSFDSAMVRRFIARNYVPERAVLCIVGNVNPKTVFRQAERYFSSFQSTSKGPVRIPTESFIPARIESERDTHQIHWVVGAPACSVYDDNRTATALLINILGGPGLNSKLNLAVREKHGYAYHIEAHYQPFTDCGYFQIYLGTDHDHFAKARQLVINQMKFLRTKRMGTMQLHLAKQQIIGQMALGRESGAAVVGGLAKSLLLYDKIDTSELVYEAIQSVKATDLQELANQMFEESKFTEVIYR